MSTPLFKEICQNCINDVAYNLYDLKFGWTPCDESNWSEGHVSCPGDYGMTDDEDDDTPFSVDEIPKHCPHRARHEDAARDAKEKK